MTAGLQIWNVAGGMILDGTHHVGKPLTVVSLTGGVSGSYTNGVLTANGAQPFAAFQRAYSFGVNKGYWYLNSPRITISGNTVTWTYDSLNGERYAENVGGILVIGIY